MKRGALAAACLAVAASLLAAQTPPPPAAAPARAPLVGIYDAEPGLLHPLILAELPQQSRPMQGFDLGLHESVPLRVQLQRGKRAGEYLIEGEPKLGITRLILPGLVNSKLRYPGKNRIRSVRFQIGASSDGSLHVAAHTGAVVKVGDREFTFADLDHDGALGSSADGYVRKQPGERQYIDRAGMIDLQPMSAPSEIDGAKYWFEIDPGGFQVIVTATEPDFSLHRAKDYETALADLNALRARLGLAPAVLNLELCAACEQHALYCGTNGEVVHEQDPAKPGHTPAGARAGLRSELTRAVSMRTAVQLFADTFYHRVNMLSPNLKAVGMGLVQGVAALDTSSQLLQRPFAPYAWPPAGATDVPRSWSNGEHPSPIGDAEFTHDIAKRWGYPITVTFPSAAVRNVRATLTAGGSGLDVFVSSPQEPGNRKFPDNARSILVMARAPLPPNVEVRVAIACEHGGKPFTAEWTFRTRAE